MKFSSDEARITAIKDASTTLGKAYGDLKYAEAMLGEAIKSYVENGTMVATVRPSEPMKTQPEVVEAPAPAKAEETPAPAPTKRGRPKKEEATPSQTAAPVVETPAPAKAEETPASTSAPAVSMFPNVQPGPVSYELLLEEMKATAARLGGKEKILAKMKEMYGIDRSSALPEDRYAEFYAVVKAL